MGNQYTFRIPAAPDGDFIVYHLEAADSGGGAFMQEENAIRSLYSGISDFTQIQRTYNEKEGSSPMTGFEVDMDVTATVQSDPATTGMVYLQSGTDPWSGVYVYSYNFV